MAMAAAIYRAVVLEIVEKATARIACDWVLERHRVADVIEQELGAAEIR